jgi:hypothetical protein
MLLGSYDTLQHRQRKGMSGYAVPGWLYSQLQEYGSQLPLHMFSVRAHMHRSLPCLHICVLGKAHTKPENVAAAHRLAPDLAIRPAAQACSRASVIAGSSTQFRLNLKRDAEHGHRMCFKSFAAPDAALHVCYFPAGGDIHGQFYDLMELFQVTLLHVLHNQHASHI